MIDRTLAAVVLAALLVGCLGGKAQLGKAQSLEEPRQLTLKIGGMTCPACPQTIESALLQLDGVAEVGISQEREIGTVVYDASKITAEEIVRSEIFSWGVYTAEVMEDRALEGAEHR